MMCHVTKPHTLEEFVKKSRFISVIILCESEQDVLRELKALHIQHPHANHIAFAYRLKGDSGIIQRVNDAGEPTGTAGKPIFQHIEGKNIINVLVVVIRYFGGVKLGVGGLTRAYGNAAKKVIDSADLQSYIEMTKIHLTLDYDQFQLFEYTLKKADGQIIEQTFAGQIQLTVALPTDKMIAFSKQFSFHKCALD